MASYYLSIGGESGGATSVQLARITAIENNEFKVAYFASVSSNTGTITIPTGATILTDQFPGGIDAYVNTSNGGQPTGSNPVTASGVLVDVTSFDSAGNYVLTGVPSIYPVCIIYLLKIKEINFANLTLANIIEYSKSTPWIAAGNDTYFNSGNVGIGRSPTSLLTVSRQSTIQTPVSGTTAHFIGLDANPLRITLDTHNTGTAGGIFLGRRSRGTSTTPSAVVSGDTMFSINTVGYGATVYGSVSTGLISFKAAENFTDSAQGTQLSVFTTPTGSITAAETFRVSAGGPITIGTWNATLIGAAYGGTGIANNAASTWAISGNFATTVTVTGATTITLPTSGTLATTAQLRTGTPVFGTSLTPADATTYYLGMLVSLPSSVAANRQFNFIKSTTITDVCFTLSQVTNASNETVTVNLRDITGATSTAIGTFTSDFGANMVKTFQFTGLSISITGSSLYALELVCPTWVTNPSTWVVTTMIYSKNA